MKQEILNYLGLPVYSAKVLYCKCIFTLCVKTIMCVCPSDVCFAFSCFSNGGSEIQPQVVTQMRVNARCEVQVLEVSTCVQIT